MYKTVRKGDASLQYTILPQTDQFSSGGFPQASGKPRPRIIKYTMATIMVLIILSCVATPFLMNQNDHNLFASTMRAISRVEPVRNTSRHQIEDTGDSTNKDKIPTTVVSTTEVTRRKEDGMTSFSVILQDEEEEEAVVDDATLAGSLFSDMPEISTQVIPSMETSTRDHQTTMTSALSSTTFSALSTTSKASSSGTTEETKSTLSTPRKPKMPRVTLKLRENETIPQMYVKAGIASYKKGNITTSVLAPRLSLEGLIFKTPKGTIKPWPQKWIFSDPSNPTIKWGVFSLDHPPMITFYAIFGVMCATACGLIALIIYVQRIARKQFKRPGQNIEEPEVEEPEVEDSEIEESTLLGAESQETKEKE
ncbi:uncharacterized protein LOC105422248 isoform X2 [Pogonomyrmex barbatus]|uniref:Uncharacterized protein LOC105422248 isoform X2 n=1 Tax=Pogonomyrmex barbatus TaxID=144034 RepID=A0A6I9VT91_9HYME|nr:uncharacterized protein LOC105422248 isoform X2 [Pogonomyrmex barbatus]